MLEESLNNLLDMGTLLVCACFETTLHVTKDFEVCQ